MDQHDTGGASPEDLARASRLCNVAAAGEILASEEVVRTMEGYRFEQRQQLQLKGPTAAVAAYRFQP